MKKTLAQNIVNIARELAIHFHDGQFRRDGVTPYIIHPQSVANRVRGVVSGWNEAFRQLAEAVAWLHDVVEDTRCTELILREIFWRDSRVVDSVMLLTKKPGTVYEDSIRSIIAATELPAARIVKIQDILSNLADSPSPAQINKYSRALLLLNN